MVWILIALLFGLGALTYSLQPVLARPGQDTVLQDTKKKDADRKTETVTFKTTIHLETGLQNREDRTS